LLNDDNLYQSVKTLSSDLSLLINDIRINPERYVHFSAVDLGKNVYINTSDKTDNSITFKVHLVSGENKVPLDSEYFEGIENVEEYQTGSVYTYLTGKTNSYTEILDLYDEVKEKFPDASIVAFKNGRIIKLEKALKRLK
jgi:phospholipid/cholesterol/gamma-HCH transport system substrate-binding protein